MGLVSGASLGIWVAVGATITDDDDGDIFGLYKVRIVTRVADSVYVSIKQSLQV